MHDHSSLARKWLRESNYIIVLETENEEKLKELYNLAQQKGILCSKFIEPDLNESLTAIVLEPNLESKKLCRSLKLAE